MNLQHLIETIRFWCIQLREFLNSLMRLSQTEADRDESLVQNPSRKTPPRWACKKSDRNRKQ
jgi:hypothetical protein